MNSPGSNPTRRLIVTVRRHQDRKAADANSINNPPGDQNHISESSPARPSGIPAVPPPNRKIIRVLGRSQSSNVYEAWNEKLGVPRALKHMLVDLEHGLGTRFNAEIQILAQLHHPNIVQVYGMGKWERKDYLETGKVDGPSLDRVINRYGPLPLQVVAAVGIMVCRALSFAHRCTYNLNGEHATGIIHKRLKPSNILLAKDGTVFLTDFGIGSALLHTSANEMQKSMKFLQYAAPEQLNRENIDQRSDIFSLGCILYEMLNGVCPFPEEDPQKLLLDRLKNNIASPKLWRRRVPENLKRLVMSCLQLSPARRPKTADDILLQFMHAGISFPKGSPETAVHEFLTSPEKWPRETGGLRRSSFNLPLTLIPVAGGALLLAIAIISWKHFSGGDPSTAQPGPGDVPQITVEAPVPQPESASPTARQAGAKKIVPEPAAAAHAEEKPIKPAPKAAKTELKETYSSSAEEKKRPVPAEERAPAVNGKEKLRGETPVSFDGLQEPQQILLAMENLLKEGNPGRLSAFFRKYNLQDKKYLLEKSKYLYSGGRNDDALAVLNRVPNVPCITCDINEIDAETRYLTAAIHTRQLTPESSVETLKNILQLWFAVKHAYRTNRYHSHFAEANEHIRSLTDEISRKENQ